MAEEGQAPVPSHPTPPLCALAPLQVAHCLLQEFPSLTTLCTLSPMPGFADWLDMRVARGLLGLDPAPLLLPQELAPLWALADGHVPASGERCVLLYDHAAFDLEPWPGRLWQEFMGRLWQELMGCHCGLTLTPRGALL